MSRIKYNSQFEKMTTQPVGSLLFSLAVPATITMTVTNIYNLVDTAFVGVLGTSQSGATGIVFCYMSIIQALAFMCGQGAGSIMSRKLGEQNIAEANIYSSTGFFFSFSLGLILSVLSLIFIDPLIYLLGSTVTIAPHAKDYIFFIILSCPFYASSLTLNNILRYEGKAKLGAAGFLTGAVLNIAGDAIFMFGMKLGVKGAGLSTTISQIIAWIILVSIFLAKKTQTSISIKYVSRKFSTFFEIAATGFPSLVRQALNTISTLLLNRASRIFGDEAVAAMSIVSRLSFFPMSIAIGIGQGFQPISGFNFGAKKFNRVKKAFWISMMAGITILTLTAIPYCVFPDFFIKLLRDDDKVIEIARRALRLASYANVIIPLTMMVEMAFQSTGKKLYASITSSLRSGIIFIPMLILFSNIRGLSGIQEAQPLSIFISSLISIYFTGVFLKSLKIDKGSNA